MFMKSIVKYTFFLSKHRMRVEHLLLLKDLSFNFYLVPKPKK